MPLYEYLCAKCGEKFEVLQKFSDAQLTVHEACGGTVERLISDAFKAYASIARAKGFLLVAASPLTRSSYHAGDDFQKMRDARNAQLARAGGTPA